MVLDKFNMVDMEGVDIIENQGVEIPGLYQKLVESIAQCRYQCLYNWKSGGVNIPPSFVELVVDPDNGNILINTGIYVTPDDIITTEALDAGIILYDPTETYQSGTVGSELIQQKNDLSELTDSITTLDTKIETVGNDALSIANMGDLPMAINRLLYGAPSDISGRNLKVKTYYNVVDVYEKTGTTQVANIVLTGTPRIVSSSQTSPFFTPIDSDFSTINLPLLRGLISAINPTSSKWWGFYKSSSNNIGNGCYITIFARYQKANEDIVTRNYTRISIGKIFTDAAYLNLIKDPITVDDETLYCNAVCIAFRVYLGSTACIGFNLTGN